MHHCHIISRYEINVYFNICITSYAHSIVILIKGQIHPRQLHNRQKHVNFFFRYVRTLKAAYPGLRSVRIRYKHNLPHKSLQGDSPLGSRIERCWVPDSDISHFPKKCKDNLYFFISECSKVNSVNSVKLEPIFILPEDRKNNNSIERKNKKEITAIIEQELEKLEDEDIDLGIIILYEIPWMLHIHEY